MISHFTSLLLNINGPPEMLQAPGVGVFEGVRVGPGVFVGVEVETSPMLIEQPDSNIIVIDMPLLG